MDANAPFAFGPAAPFREAAGRACVGWGRWGCCVRPRDVLRDFASFGVRAAIGPLQASGGISSEPRGAGTRRRLAESTRAYASGRTRVKVCGRGSARRGEPRPGPGCGRGAGARVQRLDPAHRARERLALARHLEEAVYRARPHLDVEAGAHVRG